MDSSPSSPSSRRGVWGFVKRNVWGDVQSHPVSLSRSASPEEAVAETETATTQTPESAEPGSPFQSQAKDTDPNDDQQQSSSDQPSQSSSNTRVTMVSEPSLRHGLAEGKQPFTCVYLSNTLCCHDTFDIPCSRQVRQHFAHCSRTWQALHIVA